jgi:hypothetical protein
MEAKNLKGGKIEKRVCVARWKEVMWTIPGNVWQGQKSQTQGMLGVFREAHEVGVNAVRGGARWRSLQIPDQHVSPYLSIAKVTYFK